MYLAEQIRSSISKEITDPETQLYCTISIGVVAIDEKDVSLQEWIHRADIALYQAKNQGRNCVIVYKPEELDNTPKAPTSNITST